MIKVKEMSELEMHKYGVIFQCVFDLFNDFEGVYFKIEVNGQEKILQRKDNLCVLYTLEDEKTVSYEMFCLDEEYNVSQAGFDDYELTMYGDLFTVQERNSSIVQSLKLYKRTDGVDNDGYDGLIIFVQYDIKKKTRITLTYQQIFDKENSIYYYAKERMPLQVVIEYGVFVNDGDVYRVLKKDRYIRADISSDNYYYDLITIKEYGLINFLKHGSYELQKQNEIVRYIKFRRTNENNQAIFSIPIYQYSWDEMADKIRKKGFATKIPDYLYETYNGGNQVLNEYKEVAEFLKEYEKTPPNAIIKLNLRFERTSDGDSNS